MTAAANFAFNNRQQILHVDLATPNVIQEKVPGVGTARNLFLNHVRCNMVARLKPHLVIKG
jgi:hypothetical protein